ncbi:hypothetical protein C8R43DRAFT_1140035 [Mycena crocata]|nr:hypothetical protein C8R43DRAFT_1140035 [Mycena crocata]
MAKPTSSSNKHGKRGRKTSIDSKTFRPGLEDDERLRRHRKAQSEYYARNANARRQRLELAAKKKAMDKQQKRRWDPPTDAKEHQSTVTVAEPKSPDVQMASASPTSTASERFTFKDPRAKTDSGMAEEPTPADSSDLNAAVASAASPTSEELVASRALAQLAEGVASSVLRGNASDSNKFHEVQVNENAIDDWRAGSVDSILEKAKQRSSVKSDAEAHKHTPIPPVVRAEDALAVRRGELPPGISPLTRVQEAHLQITGDIGWLTRVQLAQLEVAKLNSGVLVAPTPEHVAKWRSPATIVTDLWDASDWTKKELATNRWRRQVSRDVKKARLNCEKHEGIYELDLEEEALEN